MADVKKYVWVIPVITGIIAIISLLTPVASANFIGAASANLWIWDLYEWRLKQPYKFCNHIKQWPGNLY